MTTLPALGSPPLCESQGNGEAKVLVICFPWGVVSQRQGPNLSQREAPARLRARAREKPGRDSCDQGTTPSSSCSQTEPGLPGPSGVLSPFLSPIQFSSLPRDAQSHHIAFEPIPILLKWDSASPSCSLLRSELGTHSTWQ